MGCALCEQRTPFSLEIPFIVYIGRAPESLRGTATLLQKHK